MNLRLHPVPVKEDARAYHGRHPLGPKAESPGASRSEVPMMRAPPQPGEGRPRTCPTTTTGTWTGAGKAGARPQTVGGTWSRTVRGGSTAAAAAPATDAIPPTRARKSGPGTCGGPGTTRVTRSADPT